MKAETQARIDSIMVQVPSNIVMSEANRDIVRERVRLALLEQDRDTRHACADAVNAIAAESTISGSESLNLVVTAFCQRAHAACINAQAI